MTKFTHNPAQENFDMVSTIAQRTVEPLLGARVIGRHPNTTETVRHVVGVHQLYTTVLAAGKLIVDHRGNSIELPPENPALKRGRLKPLEVSVNPRTHAYLWPMTNPEDEADLVPFWASAVDLYRRVVAASMAKGVFEATSEGFLLSRLAFGVDPDSPSR